MKSHLVLLALLVTGCAPRYYSVALGNYAEFRPHATVRSTFVELELARSAYVAVIGITAPGPGYSHRPVLFQPIYPQWDTDATHFAAGRHRLMPRRQTLREPLNCRDDQKPTLSGCRRASDLYPTTGSHTESRQIYMLNLSHYFVLASEEFVDPYTLADDLFELTFEREALAVALKHGSAADAATDLERALLDRPGPPIWGGLYVSGR